MRLVQAGPTWTCSGCTVVAGYAEGRATPALPTGWEHRADALLCLRCARARAVAIALHEAELDDDGRGELTIEREALARFELGRDATRRNVTIAQAIGTTPAIVAGVRRKLAAEGPTVQTAQGGARDRLST
jgi:hypothetical protein